MDTIAIASKWRLVATSFVLLLNTKSYCEDSTHTSAGTRPKAAVVVGKEIVVLEVSYNKGEGVMITAGTSHRVVTLSRRSEDYISEISGSVWGANGLVVAVEIKNRHSPQLSYHWLAVNNVPALFADVHGTDEEQLTQNGMIKRAQFYEGTIDYDISGVRNTNGDSICIIISKVIRERSEIGEVSGYIYVHNCPTAVIPGSLYKLGATLVASDPSK